MKGGITSGVVYPGALFELAKEYTFRNIGGTSAGAIAAAATAAAELGRYKARTENSSPEMASFEQLAKIPEWLGGRERRLRPSRIFFRCFSRSRGHGRSSIP